MHPYRLLVLQIFVSFSAINIMNHMLSVVYVLRDEKERDGDRLACTTYIACSVLNF